MPTGCVVSDRVLHCVWADPSGRELPAPRPPRGAHQIGTFPYLSRMADPYRTYEYHPVELAALRAEVSRVIAYSTLPAESRAAFREFAGIIRAAEAGAYSVFCFGD